MIVVDDEEFCITTMKHMLKGLGINTKEQVDFCFDGLESFTQLVNCHSQGIKVDLVLTDFSMPNLNGIESTQKMRSYLSSKGVELKDQPVIIGITGHV